jgi:hypothetical protein
MRTTTEYESRGNRGRHRGSTGACQLTPQGGATMGGIQKERAAAATAARLASKEAYSNLQPVYQTACLVSSPFSGFFDQTGTDSTLFLPFSPLHKSDRQIG